MRDDGTDGRQTGQGDEGDGDFDATTALRLLQDERRRAVLRRLETGAEVPVEELTAAVVDDDRVAAETDAEHTELSLHHTHLPKLASAGVIDYDAERGVVSYRGDDLIERLLAALDEER